MEIEGNTIIFKSTPENYYKEFHGFKPNTVRRITETKERARFHYFKRNLTPDSKIRITSTCLANKQFFFERYITDITKFEDLYIISWKHEEGKQ